MSRKLLFLTLISLLVLAQPVIGHGGEEQTESDEPVSLSLEIILLLTILMGIVLLFVLFSIVGIEDKSLLYKMAVITMLLLVIDYTYVRLFG